MANIKQTNVATSSQNGPQTFGLLRFGAGNEVRTRDLNLGKVALYQLSYTRSMPYQREPVMSPVANHVALAKKWRPLGGSNPCSRRERAVS